MNQLGLVSGMGARTLGVRGVLRWSVFGFGVAGRTPSRTPAAHRSSRTRRRCLSCIVAVAFAGAVLMQRTSSKPAEMSSSRSAAAVSLWINELINSNCADKWLAQ